MTAGTGCGVGGGGERVGKVEKWNDDAGDSSENWKLRKALRWRHESDQSLFINNNRTTDE